jgi:hypothetical protein
LEHFLLFGYGMHSTLQDSGPKRLIDSRSTAAYRRQSASPQL